jgi:hypothetical protein
MYPTTPPFMPPQPKPCPHCGKPMEASTPARDEAKPPAKTWPGVPPPTVAVPTKTYESWRDRDKML